MKENKEIVFTFFHMDLNTLLNMQNIESFRLLKCKNFIEFNLLFTMIFRKLDTNARQIIYALQY